VANLEGQNQKRQQLSNSEDKENKSPVAKALKSSKRATGPKPTIALGHSLRPDASVCMEGKSIIDLKDKKTTYLASRPSLTLPDTPDGRGTRHTGNPKAEALTSHIQFCHSCTSLYRCILQGLEG
jgi:hypothetical protein